jgi:tRNA A37 methylthiotransferase MiaB
MRDQVPQRVKQERARELAVIEAELRDTYFRSLAGQRLRVLVETHEERDRWIGTSCRYATVELPATAADEGHFVDVVAGEVRGERIIATSKHEVTFDESTLVV